MKTVLAIVVVLALGLLTFGIIKKTKGRGEISNPVSRVHPDIKILLDPNTPPKVFSAKMGERALAKDPDALEVIFKRIKDKDPIIREICLSSLGFYDDPRALELLSEALSSPDSATRIEANNALLKSKGPGRIQILATKINDKNLSTQDKIRMYATLGRIGTNKEKAAAMDWLIYTAKSGTATDAEDAYAKAMQVDAKDKRIIELSKKNIELSKSTEIVAFAIVHLAQIKDNDIIKKLKNYSSDPRPDIRMASLIGLTRACTADRWVILEDRLKTENDIKILKYLAYVPRLLSGVQGRDFLNKMVQSTKLPKDVIEQAKNSLETIKSYNLAGGICG